MIVDGHTHVHADRDGLGAPYDATLDFLIENLEASDVDKAVVLAEAVDVPYIKRIENRFVAECCEKHPDKLIGFAAVHPLEENAPERLEQDVRRYNLQGLKLHPRFQGVSAADSRLVPLVEKAAELDLPIAIDAFLWKPTPLQLQLPINIDAVCKRVPEAKVIMTHAGGFHFLDALAVAVANDNVYLDVSASLTYFHDTPFEEQFIFVLKQVGAQRVVFGSDHPQEPLKPCYERSKAILQQHGFCEDELAWIFGKTLLSILPGGERLTEEL